MRNQGRGFVLQTPIWTEGQRIAWLLPCDKRVRVRQERPCITRYGHASGSCHHEERESASALANNLYLHATVVRVLHVVVVMRPRVQNPSNKVAAGAQ